MPQDDSILPSESGEEIEAALALPWYRQVFPPRLERRFEQDTAPARSAHLRFALLFLLAIHLLLLISDAQVGHIQLMRGLATRLGFEAPLFLTGIFLLRRRLPVWAQGLAGIAPVVLCIAADSWIAVPAGSLGERYFTGLGTGIFLNDIVMPLRLRHAAIATAASIAIFDAVVLGVFGPSLIAQSPTMAVDMSLFALISLAIRYNLERQYRHTFLLGARDRLHVQQLAWANRQLTELSYTDTLTSLPNRRFFDELLSRAWQAARDSAQPLSLVMIDVDRFKEFNDALGHAAGDLCLQRLAHAMQFSVRVEVDTLARYGGEEFVAILPGAAEEDALRVSERLRLAVRALAIPHPSSPQGPFVSVSVGVACCTNVSALAAPDWLLQAADHALYSAKSAGRDRVVVEPTNSFPEWTTPPLPTAARL